MTNLNELFNINYGQRIYHNKEDVVEGNTLLISSQGIDNGCYGFFDIEPNFKPPFITVPSTGSIGEAFVQNFECCVDDNCLVLTPKRNMSIEYLYYIAIMIRLQKWRFVYGRQITPERLGKLNVKNTPEMFKASLNFKEYVETITPEKAGRKLLDYVKSKTEYNLCNLFDIKSGDFHAIYKLEKGNIPLISCGERNNGLVGFYNIPKDKRYFNTITVAYNGIPLTTKFHPYLFGAKDDVAVCINSNDLKITTIIYIGTILNRMTWKFSYGRKCFQNKIKHLKISLPTDANGDLDEEYIEKCVKNTSYWNFIEAKIS